MEKVRYHNAIQHAAASLTMGQAVVAWTIKCGPLTTTHQHYLLLRASVASLGSPMVRCVSVSKIDPVFVPLGVGLLYMCTLTQDKLWKNGKLIVTFVDLARNRAGPSVDAFEAQSEETVMLFSTFTDVYALQPPEIHCRVCKQHSITITSTIRWLSLSRTPLPVLTACFHISTGADDTCWPPSTQ